MVGAEALDQPAHHQRVVRDGVEVELLQVRRRLALDDGARVRTGAPGMVHARPVVGDEAAAVRHQHLELGIARHHPVEDQVRHRYGGFQRVADDVVEVVVAQALAVGVAQRVHEDQHAQFLAAREEFLQPQGRVGQVLAVDVGADLHPAQAEVLDRMVQLAHRQFGVLQRHRAQADEAVRMAGHHLRDAFVDLAGQFGAQARLGEIEEVIRRRAHRLHVHAHAVHVFQSFGHARQLGRAGGHLLDVGLVGQGIGVDDGGVMLRGVQVRGLGIDLGVEVVAMQVHHQALAPAVPDDGPRTRGRAALGGQGAERAVLVRRVLAVGQAGVEHAGLLR